MIDMTDRRPNHALQRTRPSLPGCNRPTTWALIIFGVMFGTGALIRHRRARLNP